MKMQMGFDDITAKLEWHETQHAQAIINMSACIIFYGQHSIAAIKAEYDVWHAYLAWKIVEIEMNIKDDELRHKILHYVHSLSATYNLQKCKIILDKFMAIVRQSDAAWIRLQVFMRKYPIS